jgi:hypothetical protein
VPADLERLARDFATTVQGLLNQTICKDIRIAAVVSPDPNVVLVGYGLGRASLLTARFPVGIKGRKPPWPHGEIQSALLAGFTSRQAGAGTG